MNPQANRLPRFALPLKLETVLRTPVRVRPQLSHMRVVGNHTSPDDPQYEIKSDKTSHVAMHKGDALTKL